MDYGYESNWLIPHGVQDRYHRHPFVYRGRHCKHLPPQPDHHFLGHLPVRILPFGRKQMIICEADKEQRHRPCPHLPRDPVPAPHLPHLAEIRHIHAQVPFPLGKGRLLRHRFPHPVVELHHPSHELDRRRGPVDVCRTILCARRDQGTAVRG